MLELSRQCVLLDLQATSKESALREIAEAMGSECPHIDAGSLGRILMEREQVGSTGVGNGVAIPHGRIKGLEQIVLSFGRSRQGIHFDAIDNRPVQLFVTILSPADLAGQYLKTLGQVSRLLKQSENRDRLLHARDRQTVIDFFKTSVG